MPTPLRGANGVGRLKKLQRREKRQSEDKMTGAEMVDDYTRVIDPITGRRCRKRGGSNRIVWQPDDENAQIALLPASGYEGLAAVLQAAHDQSAYGKGKVRHANSKPFVQQPIMEIGRMVGTGYQTGQAMKKAQEAGGMLKRGEHGAARAELLGAIVYLAAAVMLIDELAAMEEGT